MTGLAPSALLPGVFPDIALAQPPGAMTAQGTRGQASDDAAPQVDGAALGRGIASLRADLLAGRHGKVSDALPPHDKKPRHVGLAQSAADLRAVKWPGFRISK